MAAQETRPFWARIPPPESASESGPGCRTLRPLSGQNPPRKSISESEPDCQISLGPHLARPCDWYVFTLQLTLPWASPSGNPSGPSSAPCCSVVPKPKHVLLPVVFYSARTSHANNIVCQGHQHVMYTSLSAALGLLHRCCWSLLPNMMHTNSPAVCLLRFHPALSCQCPSPNFVVAAR